MFRNNDALAHTCPISIEKAAHTEMTNTGYSSLNSVRCRFQQGTLTLKGKVPSYYHKQLAQEATRKIGNVKAIVNKIDVVS
jgi:hypothetical protein